MAAVDGSVSARNIAVTHVATNSDWVILSRAALTLPLARCTDDTTEAPTPSISPIPIITIVGAMHIFTAARASLPHPRPTKIPSVAVTAHSDSIPSKVGTK